MAVSVAASTPRKGLVEQDEVGLLGQGAGEEHPLLLAPRERADLARGEVGQADPGEAVHRAGAQLGARNRPNRPISRCMPITTTSMARAGKSSRRPRRCGT